MCSFDILLPIGGAVSLFSGCCFVVFGALFRWFRGVVLNFRGLDFNFTKVTILLHIPQYLFPFFQLLNSEAYRLRIVLRSPSDQIPSAVRSDSVRRPIGFRSPPDQIPFAVRWQCLSVCEEKTERDYNLFSTLSTLFTLFLREVLLILYLR